MGESKLMTKHKGGIDMKRHMMVTALIIIFFSCVGISDGSSNFQLLSLSASGSPTLNRPVTFNTSSDNTNLYYKFWISGGYGTAAYGNWQVIKEWSHDNFCQWTPLATDRYVVVVWAKDTLQAEDYEIIGNSFEVQPLNVNVSGTYNTVITGYDNGQPFTQHRTVTISQNQNTISGNWSESGGSGTYTGTLTSNSTVSVNVTEFSPNYQTYTTEISILDHGELLKGSYSGLAGGDTVQFDFTLTRQ
jgi:hypothetical protein